MYIELCVFGFMVQFWHCIVVEKKEICGLLHSYKNKFCFIFCYIIYLVTEYPEMLQLLILLLICII